MYVLVTLDGTNSKKFADLATSKSKKLLLKMSDDCIGFGIEHKDEPVGLVFAIAPPTSAWPTILCLNVVDEHQHQGLGKQLLDQIEQTFVTRGYERAGMEYLADSDAQSGRTKITDFAVESFCMNNGWGKFSSTIDMYTVSSERLKDCHWLNTIHLPPDFSIFPWSKLLLEERHSITNGKDHCYPSDLSPFFEEDKSDPQYSLGLRYKGEVVGWLITQRVARNMLYYKTLFVQDQYRELGRGISLLGIGLKNAVEGGLTYGVFSVDRRNVRMISFVTRRLAPLVIRKNILRVSEKIFKRN